MIINRENWLEVMASMYRAVALIAVGILPVILPVGENCAQETGDLIIPSIDGQFIVDGQSVAWGEYNFPLTVKSVEGDQLWLGPGFVKKEQAIPIESAVEHFTHVLREDPANPTALRYRGIVWTYQGKFELAVNDLKAAIWLVPDNEMAYYHLGKTFDKQSNWREAIKQYSKAIELQPSEATFFNSRGTAWKSLQNYDQAIKDHSQAIRLAPGWSTPHNDRGGCWAAMGKTERAFRDYNRAIELNPDYAYAYNNRGLLFRRTGDSEKAIEDLGKAISLDPKYETAWYNRALVRVDRGEYDLAISDLTKAIELFPEFATFRENRGICYRLNGEYEKAKMDFESAVKLDPKNPSIYNNFAWFLAVCADRKYRDGERAVEYATKACEMLGWKSYNELDTYAVANAAVGNFDEAVESTLKVIELAKQKSVDTRRFEARLRLFRSGRPYHESK